MSLGLLCSFDGDAAKMSPAGDFIGLSGST